MRDNFPEYIRELLLNIEAKQSNLTIVETKDPVRIKIILEQLCRYMDERSSATESKTIRINELKKALLTSNAEERKRILEELEQINSIRPNVSKLINYDIFTKATIKILRNGELRTIPYEDKSWDPEIGSVPEFIIHIDKKLKKSATMASSNDRIERIFLTITGIKGTESIRQWEDALYEWAFSEEIWAISGLENHIIVFVPSFDIIPKHILEKANTVSPPFSTAEERRGLYKGKLDEPLVNASAGLTLHQLDSAIAKSITKYKWGLSEKKISIDDITDIKRNIVMKSGILAIEKLSYGFDRIGGYQSIKSYIRDSIIKVISNPERAQKFGLSMPRGMIMIGPGGTGKSLFAKAIAYETGMPLINLQYSKILDKYVGSSERNFSEALKTIEELSPCFVFVDEIDQLGKRNGRQEMDSGGGSTSGRLFSQLLEYLGNEDRKAIFIAATNNPECLDKDMIRSGRFDFVVPVLYPDEDARKQIFNIHASVKRNLPINRLEYNQIEQYISRETNLFSGADIEELVLRAARKAFLEESSYFVSLEHFTEAKNQFNIDLEERAIRRNEFEISAAKLCSNMEFFDY